MLAMSETLQTVELRQSLEVILPNGEKYLLRPGPYGRGIAVIGLEERVKPLRVTAPSTGKRGRKPRASTIKLRERLEKDATAGRLGDNQRYVKWLVGNDDTIGLPVARQVVYRERRKYL